MHDGHLAAEAAEHLAAALTIEPDHVESMTNLGMAFAALGQHDRAVMCYQNVVRLDPDHLNAYINLGVSLSACERYDEALRYLRKALELNPDNPDAHYNIGLVYLKRERLVTARWLMRPETTTSPSTSTISRISAGTRIRP